MIHSWANPDGTQKIVDDGPLTIKRIETIDEEVTKLSLEYLEKAKKADKPFFLWWNSTRMHVWTDLKKKEVLQTFVWVGIRHSQGSPGHGCGGACPASRANAGFAPASTAACNEGCEPLALIADRSQGTHTKVVHFHCCVIDGVFAVGEDGQVHFAEAAALTPEDLAAVQQQVRARVLRWFARAGHLDPADARDMAGWHHGGGFSLDAAVRIEGSDRAGLERLLRYCARPPFALERLEQVGDDQLVYRFAKPLPDGRTELRLTPLELIERLAALIPPPRLHRHRYHGVLAPNAPLRAQVIAWARPPSPPLPAAHPAQPPCPRPRATLGAAAGAHLRDFAPALRAVRGPDAHHCLHHRRPGAPRHPHLPGRAHHPSRSGPRTRSPAVGAGGRARGPLGRHPRTRARVRLRPAPELVAHRPFPAARPAPPTGLTARFCRAGPKP